MYFWIKLKMGSAFIVNDFSELIQFKKFFRKIEKRLNEHRHFE